MFDRTLLLKLAQTHESFYLYDQRVMLSHLFQLRSAIPWAHFLYSVKANPHHAVLDTVFSQGFGGDAASLGEVELCRMHGLKPEEIFFSAPGKPASALAGALGRCTLVADSLGEIERIEALAEERETTADIGLRVNPNFTFTADTGAPGKFGVDEEQLFDAMDRLKAMKRVRLVGIHVHLKSQELDEAVLERYYRKLLELAEKVAEALGRPLGFLNLGSGLGIPFGAQDASLDVSALGVGVSAQVEAFRRRFPETKLYIETGRFVTGRAGIYATHVTDVKTSRGKRYALLANTLNGFARPSLAQLVSQYTHAPQPPMWEPLFTCRRPYRIYVLNDAQETETVTLAGNLCTAADLVEPMITLPKLSVGDVVVFTNAGCYAAVISPVQFASLEPPAQLFLTEEGQILE